MNKVRTTHTPSGYYRCGDETDEEVEARVARNREILAPLFKPLEPWEYAVNAIIKGLVLASCAGLGAYIGYRLGGKKEDEIIPKDRLPPEGSIRGTCWALTGDKKYLN